MIVWVNGNSAIVKCRYEERELVKAIGDYKFDKQTSSWVFPLHKLVDIIDSLKIEYSPAVSKVYESLRVERQEYHKKINLANQIKSSPGPIVVPTDLPLHACYDHQKRAIQLASIFDSYALFMETGTGKSMVAIRLIEYWGSPAMIVAPLSTIESVWVKEIQKWSWDEVNKKSKLSVVNLWNNLEAFNKPYDVYLINYEQFKKLAASSDNLIQKKIGCLVIDESSKLKSNNSAITKTILKYKDKIKHRLCLTGTPAPNNLLEYWGQMAFVNSKLLGDNFYKFRNVYFYATGYGGYLYKPKTGAQEAIIDQVHKQAFSIRKADCLDLPDRVFEIRYVYMDALQQKAYDAMKKENILEFKDTVTLGANELAKIMKLRQITSGFTITTEGAPVSISNTKINALKELIDDIPEDQQVIIWCNFHFEIETLRKEFEGYCCTLYGDMPQKSKQDSILAFQNKEFRILLAHPLSGGMGLTFTNCSYIIWFSMNYSQEQYSQANDRIYRIGQKNKCTYFLLMAKDTIDEVIYKALQKKGDLMELCMEMLKKG